MTKMTSVLVRGTGLAVLLRNRMQAIVALHELTARALQPGALRAVCHAACLIKVALPSLSHF